MLLQRFLKDRRGGITPMFALAIMPVIGLDGAAIDYSRANSVRSRHAGGRRRDRADAVEGRLDADARASSRTKATAYFNALFNRPEAKGLTVTPTYTDHRRLAARHHGSGDRRLRPS